MFEKIHKVWMPAFGRRRRRVIEEARRQITSCGYDLDDITDSQLETAITISNGSIEDVSPLTAKTIFWTLRRIAHDRIELKQRQIGGNDPKVSRAI